MSGSILSQELLHAVLTDGSYRRHVEKVRVRLGQAMHRTIGRLKAIGIEPWTEPAAGLFLWCRLPDGVEAIEVARGGLLEDIIYAPGNVFSPSRAAGNYLRFNVAMMDDDRIFANLERVCASPTLASPVSLSGNTTRG